MSAAVKIFVILFIAGLSANAATLSTYWISKVEKSVMNKVADKFEVTHRSGDGFEVVVPAGSAAEFKKLVPTAKLLEADIQAAARKQLQTFKLLKNVNGYRNLEQVQSRMKEIEAKNPVIAQVSVYGKSKQGRDLMALKISSNAKSDTNKPEIMLTAATHGDELITTEVLLGLIDELLAGVESKNERFLNILANYEIFFVPVLNVDGFASTERYDGGKDPNRSYPWPEMPDAQPTASIAGIIKFFESHKIEASIDFHAYGGMVMFPWGYTEDSLSMAEFQRFDPISAKMAETNGYVYGPIATTIYVAKGSSVDYYYWKTKSLSLAIEIGKSKIPNPSEIPSLIKSQSESTWMFVESVK